MASNNSVSPATIFSPDPCADSKCSYCITYCETLLKQKRPPGRAKSNPSGLDYLEGNAYAYCCVIEQIASFDADYPSAFYTGKAAFFPGQGHCPREIQFDYVACVQGRRYRKANKNTGLADIGASAIKKLISFRQPDADRPRNLRS
jgi:hypothetical protein